MLSVFTRRGWRRRVGQRSPGNQAAAGAGRVLSWGHLYTIHGDISLSEEKPNSRETNNSVVI